MPDARPSEIVEEAAKRGLQVTEHYVTVLRSSDRAKAGLPLRRRSSTRSTSSGREAEATVRRGFVELGLARGREILAEVEAAFKG